MTQNSISVYATFPFSYNFLAYIQFFKIFIFYRCYLIFPYFQKWKEIIYVDEIIYERANYNLHTYDLVKI